MELSKLEGSIIGVITNDAIPQEDLREKKVKDIIGSSYIINRRK